MTEDRTAQIAEAVATMEGRPCPFCGSKPYVTRTVNGEQMFKVGCASCGLELKAAWYRDELKPTKDILALWNSRPASVPTEEPRPLTADDLEHAISAVLNRFSAENASNTPDFILAQFLLGCLAVWNQGVQQRETWYGRDARPSTPPLPEVRALPAPEAATELQEVNALADEYARRHGGYVGNGKGVLMSLLAAASEAAKPPLEHDTECAANGCQAHRLRGGDDLSVAFKNGWDAAKREVETRPAQEVDPLAELKDAERNVPLDVRQELLACATSNGRISYHWLCRVYKRGVEAGAGPAPSSWPDFWRCKTCGCLWCDNHDETVSLASEKQTSCSECEMKGSHIACEPLWRAAGAPALRAPKEP